VLAADASLPGPLQERRARGLALLDAGRYLEAKEIFEEILNLHPGNLATAVLLDTAAMALRESQARAVAELSRVPVVRVETPRFAYDLRSLAPARHAGGAPKLRKLAEAKNEITDEERWFERNALESPLLKKQESLPPKVPTALGRHPLDSVVRQSSDRLVLLFGEAGSVRFVGLLENDHATALFDFAAFQRAPRSVPAEDTFTVQSVLFAQAQGGVLYVSTGHRTYAKSSGGQNAFVTAVDIRTGKLLWQSQPLVSNAVNFLLLDGYILCGYGFTAEPDYLYVLDAADGKVISRTQVRSGPEYIIKKDSKIHVRTYDTDYVFVAD
jgi:hypothetical protein